MEKPKVGQRIEVHSVKYDGSPHRWWFSQVKSCDARGILLDTPGGTRMFGPKGGWNSRGGLTRLWWDRWYNVYQAPKGAYTLLYYIHIATPPRWDRGKLTYVDLDLDVIMGADGTVQLVDEDEFALGIEQYGYPDHVIKKAEAAAHEVQLLLAQSPRPWGDFT